MELAAPSHLDTLQGRRSEGLSSYLLRSGCALFIALVAGVSCWRSLHTWLGPSKRVVGPERLPSPLVRLGSRRQAGKGSQFPLPLPSPLSSFLPCGLGPRCAGSVPWEGALWHCALANPRRPRWPCSCCLQHSPALGSKPLQGEQSPRLPRPPSCRRPGE